MDPDWISTPHRAIVGAEMQRRTAGQGSIRLRTDGRWEVRIFAGRRRISRVLPVGANRRDAERVREELVRSERDGRLLGTPRQTVEMYLRSWLAGTAANTLRPRSLERYTSIVEQHILPTAGQLQLDRFSEQHVVKLHELWARSVSPATVRYHHSVLRSAFRQAVDWRLIDRNPARAVHPPRRMRRPMRALSTAEARHLLDGAHGDELEALYTLALTTGMRLGELLGLKWEDVELRPPNARVSVQRSLVRVSGTWLFGEPKSERSRRGVALSARASATLRAHRLRQNRQRLAAGPSWADHDLVFAGDNGEPLYGAHITERCLKPLLRRLGLPLRRFHDLRHTAATLLLTQGINPKVVSEMLGHASVELTLDNYSHVLPDMQAQVAVAMDTALG